MSKETIPTMPTKSVLTNQQFYAKCVSMGNTAKTAVREFLALLPEAEDRKIYLEHGMSSIFEFAAKLGGVSREQVLLTLRLEQRFEDLPQLKQALLSGEVPVHKLARVASVVTKDTQEFWASQAKLLSNRALETLVQDTKSMRTHVSKPNKTEKVEQFEELNLAPDVRQQLLDMQNKGIDHNQVLRELLKERSQRIQQEKEKIGVEKIESKPSRYIPAQVKHLLKQEYGEKCAQDHCKNRSTNIHHTRRFGLNPSHNPHFLAPLCQQHHEIAHAIDIKSVKYKVRQ